MVHTWPRPYLSASTSPPFPYLTNGTYLSVVNSSPLLPCPSYRHNAIRLAPVPPLLIVPAKRHQTKGQIKGVFRTRVVDGEEGDGGDKEEEEDAEEDCGGLVRFAHRRFCAMISRRYSRLQESSSLSGASMQALASQPLRPPPHELQLHSSCNCLRRTD